MNINKNLSQSLRVSIGSNRILRRRFVAIFIVFAVVLLALWAVYHNTVFSQYRSSVRESIELAEYSLLSRLDDEFSRMRLVSSSLAGSIYVQDFLAEGSVTAYYEKAEAVAEIIRKSTYPHLNSDSIVTFTANGTAYRFTGGISAAAADKIYREVILGGAPVYSIVELDGVDYFCLIDPVSRRGTGTTVHTGHVVTLSNIAKVRRTVMDLGMVTGVDTAVILEDVILLSSNPELDGKSYAELERRYGSVVVNRVTGTNLFAAAAITGETLYYGERLFMTVSIAAILIFGAAIALLYRMLSTRMVSPLLEKTETMKMGLLKTQMNAHFIVNTIDCIERLSETGENERAAIAARNLAGMIRDVHEADDEINIYEQLDALGRYIEIMNIRSDDKFVVEIDADDRLVEYRMPAQVLQPLVENALTHGLGNKTGDCRLTITGRAGKDCVVLEVSDNGKGMEPETVHALQELLDGADEWEYTDYHLKGVALVNIQKRIRSRYGKRYGLSVRSSPNEGLAVSVRLPYIEDR